MVNTKPRRFSILAFTLIVSCCWVANGEPPRPWNRLLQLERERMADPSGGLRPQAMDSDTRTQLEAAFRGKQVKFSLSNFVTPPELQLEAAAKALLTITRENIKLKRRNEELKSELNSCRGIEPEAD